MKISLFEIQLYILYFRLILLNKLLEDGNTLFKKNKLSEASQRYQYAAKRVPSTHQGDHNKKVFDQLRIHLLLNLSRCKRKMLDYSEAVKVATEVIDNHPSCYEALHARAKGGKTCFPKFKEKKSQGNLEEKLKKIEKEIEKYREELKKAGEERKKKDERINKKQRKQAHWDMMKWVVKFIDDNKVKWDNLRR